MATTSAKGAPPMMGGKPRSEPLFYYFRLEDQIPKDHLLRRRDRCVDFSFVRERLKDAYSRMGRPSIDPEVLLRMLLGGYLYGITSERRLVEEIRMHLAYRWFTRLGFEQEVPDHSTFSKNRHGRFRESGIFLAVFEEVVRRCIQAGLVGGRRMTVDGTVIRADASLQSGVERKHLEEVAQVSRTVREYLAEVAQQDPVADPADRPPAPRSVAAQIVSKTEPDACWIGKWGPSAPSYLDHYLIDNAHRIIVGVEATTARSAAEPGGPPPVAASEGAVRDWPGKPGSGQGLGERRVPGLAVGTEDPASHPGDRSPSPDAPAIYPRRLPVRPGRKRLSLSRGEAAALPGRVAKGPELSLFGQARRLRELSGEEALYAGAYRKVSVHWQEPARQATRDLVLTAAYARSRRERNKVEAVFSELKLRVGLKRVRLRRLWNVAEQFYLAATAQNLKWLVKFVAQSEALPSRCAT